MNPNRLSTLFFAAALLLAGTAVAGVLVRLGAGTDAAQAQATGRPSFAEVLTANSPSDAAPAAAPVVVAAAAPTIATPSAKLARRVGARAVRIRRHLVVIACPETREAPGVVGIGPSAPPPPLSSL